MRSNILVLAMLPLAFCGCTKIEETAPALVYVSESETTAAETYITQTETFSEAVSETEVRSSVLVSESSESGETESVPNEWDPEFYKNSLFYGDSICRALSVYNGLADPERVAAAGGAAARNLDEFTFLLNDIEYTVSSAAEDMKPDKAFVWLGMNDINMTEKDVYVKNLNHIAEEIHTASPDTVIIIIGITPTASYHEWGANPKIREYNFAAKEYAKNTPLPVEFTDPADVLTDENGYLLKECDGGDGLHLTELALQRVLSKIYNTFGKFYPTPTEEETVSSETEISQTATPATTSEETAMTEIITTGDVSVEIVWEDTPETAGNSVQ